MTTQRSKYWSSSSHKSSFFPYRSRKKLDLCLYDMNFCRMEELIPILIQYFKSHQKPGGRTRFVAHNVKTFDVPFLIKEFKRCGYKIPSDWLFLDTMPFARVLMKAKCPDFQVLNLKESLSKLTSKHPPVYARDAVNDIKLVLMIWPRSILSKISLEVKRISSSTMLIAASINYQVLKLIDWQQ